MQYCSTSACVTNWVISIAVIVVAASYETLFHFLFMLAVTGFMLVTEVLNTAIESLCDYVEPAVDERIKNIKDVAAAAAMIAIIVWYIVIAIILFEFFQPESSLATRFPEVNSASIPAQLAIAQTASRRDSTPQR